MLTLLATLSLAAPPTLIAPPKTARPVSGANLCGDTVTIQQFEAAANVGLKVLRLSPDAWPSKAGTFLLGDPLQYERLIKDDVHALKKVLDLAERSGLRIVLSIRSLPGREWRGSTPRPTPAQVPLWTSESYQQQAVSFWTALSAEIGQHPALLAIDPMHAPFPLYVTKGLTDPRSEAFSGEVARSRGLLADSDRLYARIIAGIRSNAPTLPVIVQSMSGGTPAAFRYVRPQADSAVLYGFSAFEPREFTQNSRSETTLRYPDAMPGQDSAMPWTRQRLRGVFEDVFTFQTRHRISSSRVVAVGFGAHRLGGGVVGYLSHLTSVFREAHWHRFFSCYRSGSAPEFDYELGTRPDATRRSNNSLWKVIRGDFQKTVE